jgi:hypothetical protein
MTVRALGFTFCLFLALTVIASGSSLPVANFSFETLPSGGLPMTAGCSLPGCAYSIAPIPGWTNSGYSGQAQLGSNYFNSIPDGITIAYSNNAGGTIMQSVGTVAANTTYTLRVDLGLRKDGFESLGTVALLVGSTPVYATGVTPTLGNWSTFTAIYNAAAADLGKPLTIQLTATGMQSVFDNVRLDASPATPQIMILPQLAFGGGWYTALYFTNLNSSPASFTVSFIGNDGNPLTVPVLGGSSATVNLAARGTALIEIPNAGALVQGYVSAALPAGVIGYGVFRQTVPGVNDQEAVVPLSGTTATTSTLEFDDTKYVTGVAVVNLASVSTTISVFAHDAQGNTIGTSNVSLAPHAKTAVVLRDLPGLAGVSGSLGSVDFTTSIGTLAALGLRFNGTAFTSIPTSDR